MKFYDGIYQVLRHKGNFQQGNYCGYTDGNAAAIRMFGNKIFEYWHPTKTFTYSFCGHKGCPMTARTINYCLDAVGAGFRVHCRGTKSAEDKVSGRPQSTGHEV